MSVKYRIEFGNCGDDINTDVMPTPVDGSYRADTTLKTADNTVLTADYSL